MILGKDLMRGRIKFMPAVFEDAREGIVLISKETGHFNFAEKVTF